MESALGVKYNSRGEIQGTRCVIRYADDFCVFCETEKDTKTAKDVINTWLKTRGLELSPEKTRIMHITEGFDFLSFNIRQYKVNNTKTGYKLLIRPSKEYVKKCRADLREIFLENTGKHLDYLIGKINSVIRGKANYMNKVVSSKIFNDLDTYLFMRQVRYVKRKHPKKSKKWTKNKYWGKLNLRRNNNWVFGNKETGNHMLKFSWTKIKRHALVPKRYSPDDPSLKEYWEERRSNKNKSEAQKLNKRLAKVAERQKYKCQICGESIFNDEPLHLHHIIPKSEGGKDDMKNLTYVHLYCHHKIHHQKE